MLSRISRTVAQLAVKRTTVVRAPVSRAFGAHASHGHDDHKHGHHDHKHAAGDVIVPELVDTLEWVLDSPPNVHQFEEPPVIVEIEHLKNLKFHAH